MTEGGQTHSPINGFLTQKTQKSQTFFSPQISQITRIFRKDYGKLHRLESRKRLLETSQMGLSAGKPSV